jgi:predicted secreted protein
MAIMDDSEDPTQLSVDKGQEFKVELESFPGSGAVWRYVSPAGPQLVSETTKSRDDSIGAAALQVFTLRADVPGSYDLIFELKRAWESSPRRRKEIKVEVS